MKKIRSILLAGIFGLAANFAPFRLMEGSSEAAVPPVFHTFRVEVAAPDSATSTTPAWIFAERRDEGDYILYQTDPGYGTSHEELQRREEEKEERSWQMLERIYVLPEEDDHHHPPPRPRPGRRP